MWESKIALAFFSLSFIIESHSKRASASLWMLILLRKQDFWQTKAIVRYPNILTSCSKNISKPKRSSKRTKTANDPHFRRRGDRWSSLRSCIASHCFFIVLLHPFLSKTYISPLTSDFFYATILSIKLYTAGREESRVTNRCAMRMNMMCACDSCPCYLCCVA